MQHTLVAAVLGPVRAPNDPTVTGYLSDAALGLPAAAGRLTAVVLGLMAAAFVQQYAGMEHNAVTPAEATMLWQADGMNHKLSQDWPSTLGHQKLLSPHHACQLFHHCSLYAG